MKTKLLLLVLVLLLLTACSGFRGGPSMFIEDYHEGSDGVLLYYLENTPARTINEEQRFDMRVLLENLGARDLQREDIWLETTIDASLLEPQGNIPAVRRIDEPINGKSLGYPVGEEILIDLGSYRAMPIKGSFETIDTAFITAICYPYSTSFGTNICIDTNVDGDSLRPTVCETQEVLRFRDQGAPIAVTQVRTTFQAVSAFVQPVFTFTIRNVGDGTVRHPAIACDALNSTTINHATFTAFLANETLDCPETIVFEDGEVEIDCFMNSNGILRSRSNYVTSLTARINYSYSQRFSKEVTIERQSPYYQPKTQSVCAPWETKAANNTCVSLCAFCADNLGDSRCVSNEPMDTVAGQNKRVQPYARCLYNRQECVRVGDECISEEGTYCYPDFYCGVPECVYNDNRNDRPYSLIVPNSDPSRLSFSCQDKENTYGLIDACGCKSTAQYAPIKPGEDCPDNGSQYIDVTGTLSAATLSTVFSIDRSKLPAETNRICVKVEDVQGKTFETKLRVD